MGNRTSMTAGGETTNYSYNELNQLTSAGDISYEYDEEGKLTLVPDITILDPSGMSVKHGVSIRIKDNRLAYGRLPSKGFEFGGKAIIIEIKFEKSKKGISEYTVQKIREDLEI